MGVRCKLYKALCDEMDLFFLHGALMSELLPILVLTIAIRGCLGGGNLLLNHSTETITASMMRLDS